MQIWTVCFLIFFLATQAYQMVKEVSLPLPLAIAGGILLAIASNIQRPSTPSSSSSSSSSSSGTPSGTPSVTPSGTPANPSPEPMSPRSAETLAHPPIPPFSVPASNPFFPRPQEKS